MKPRLFSIIILFTLIYSMSLAQVKITGNIVDAGSKEAIEYVNISLFKKDSTFIDGVITDEKGMFAFNNMPPNDYIVAATFIGYKNTHVSINNPQKNTDLGKIDLNTSDVVLGDVTVTAKSVVYKSDRQVIMPTEAQLKASNSGLKLLENLNLSRIKIDPMTQAVSMLGNGNVQLRINGVEVSKDEIVALLPQDIVRIEFHDDPGMRYNNAGAVIDFITRRKESGGNISTNLSNGVVSRVGFAEDYISAKVNHKKSEFTAIGNWHYRNIEWTRENNETYVFPNKVLTRNEIGEPTKFKESNINASLNYSLLEADKYMLNVRLRNNNEYTPNDFSDRTSTMHSSDGSSPISISNHSSSRSNAPSLDVYYQRNLKNDQLLIFNVVGTYIDSKSNRTYSESGDNDFSIYSNIVGDKYSIITEGIYEKGLKAGKISAGVKHTQSYTKNTYLGNVNTNIAMNLAETYAYTEYQLKKGKFNYMFGLGAMRTYNSQGGENNEKYIFRPALRVAYNINDNTFIRYNGSISGYSPSLSDLNNVQQDIDSLQIRRGNPNLKTVRNTYNALTAGYNKGVFSFELYADYNYDWNPIMEQVTFENNKFVRMNINQKSFHRIGVYTTFKLKVWKDYIALTVSPRFRRFISNGENYTHTYNNWGVWSQGRFMYKGWMANFELGTRYCNLWGERINRGERYHAISAGYNKEKWSAGVWIFNPFSKNYSQYDYSLSALAPGNSVVYSKDLGGATMIAINLTYNINFGRQYKSANKRINNDDSDAGIMKGTK